MSSYLQNNKEQKPKATFLSTYVKNMSGNATDKDSPRRTIIELKELIVDGGIDDSNIVVASIDSDDNKKCAVGAVGGAAAATDFDGDKSIDGCIATPLLTPTPPPTPSSPLPPSMPAESMKKAMPSTNIDDECVNSIKTTKSVSNDCCSDEMCEATAKADDTNNKETIEKKVRHMRSNTHFFTLFGDK